MLKTKEIENKLSPHSTSHLKSKKPCGQFSIKAFLNKTLPKDKGNLNMNTSESCAVERSFSSSSVLSPKLLFSSEKSRNVENSLFNKNLEVPTSSSSFEIPDHCISKDISVKNLEEPTNIISTGKYDSFKINYPEKFIKIVQNSNSASISSPGVLKKADNLALSINSNSGNISFSSKKPTVAINSFNSTSKLISSSKKSSNELMSRKTLVDKLEQPSNLFCIGKYGNYNVNTFQHSTNTVQKFNSDLSKVSDLPLPASEKTVTATISCFDSNPEFLSSCSNKSVIVDSPVNTAGESSDVDAVSTCNRYDVATYRSKTPFISDIKKN